MYNPQLDTFVQVAESGSFSAAAQALYVTPTAVIKQMNLLEARLGVKLFNRSHHGLTLTPAGESLLVDARHIIRYSRESIERARAADRGEKRVIRMGVSLITPATQVTELWQRVRKRCPNMALQVVTFENTTHNAHHILAHLGEDIDVVGGVFDPALLRERSCAGLPTARLPVRIAVPVDSSLADLEQVSLDDLHGHTLMLLQHGGNEDLDQLRREVWLNHPQITVCDFPQYKAEVFNTCASEGYAIASLDLWKDVQPMLRTLPATWNYEVTYGLLYALQPTELVTSFLEAVREELDS